MTSTIETNKIWPPDALVTLHFAAREFVCPALYGLPGVPYPQEWISTRLYPLCSGVLEILRGQFDRPVRILTGGGYRTPEFNAAHRAAGHEAAERSQHLFGLAADIEVQDVPASKVQQVALYLHKSGAIRLGGLGSYASFTHLDIRPGELAQWTG